MYGLSLSNTSAPNCAAGMEISASPAIHQRGGQRKKLIAHDDEAYLLHYYLQRGILPDYILSLDTLSRAFLAASMATAQEERRQFWGLGGDG